MLVIFRILKLVYRKHKYRVIAGNISVIGSAFTALAIPQIIGMGVNSLVDSASGKFESVYLLSLVLLLAGIGRGLFSYGQTYFGDSVAQRVAFDIRNAYFNKLQHLSFAFHDKQSTGSLMSRSTADVEGMRMFISMGAVRSGFIISMIIGISVAMFMVDWKLALVSLSFVPFLIWRAVVTSFVLNRVWTKVQEFTADLTAMLQENIIGNRVVKAFAAEQHENDKFRTQSDVVAKQIQRAQTYWAGTFSLMNFGFMAAIAAILWVGGTDIINGREVINDEVIFTNLTPGDLTAFIFYMGLLAMPVRMLGWMVNSFSRGASCGKRIFEILDTPSPVQESENPIILTNTKGHVVFKNVAFGYTKDTPALKNINFEVLPGQTIALLGRPGSGKSTLSHLVPRFYDVNQGAISIDGIDVRNIELNSLRSNVSIVQQDVFIFAMSVRDNIAYGKADACLDQIKAAAKVAQLDEFIMTLSDEYETMVGERGVSLSGGQKQRLTIARSIINDSPILILDDATSSVDVQTDHKLMEAVHEARLSKTTFIVTHRLSTCRNADIVLMFENGEIIERGSHKELLAQNGAYRRLYQVQISDIVDYSDKILSEPESQRADND